MGPSFVLLSPARPGGASRPHRQEPARNLPNLQPVGWYHSHTRSDIFLSDADQDIRNNTLLSRTVADRTGAETAHVRANAGGILRARAGWLYAHGGELSGNSAGPIAAAAARRQERKSHALPIAEPEPQAPAVAHRRARRIPPNGKSPLPGRLRSTRHWCRLSPREAAPAEMDGPDFAGDRAGTALARGQGGRGPGDRSGNSRWRRLSDATVLAAADPGQSSCSPAQGAGFPI